MNTNSIKSFAKEVRLLLIDGVSQQLKFWGFDDNGKSTHPVEKIQGGYLFRGQVFTDETVPEKWKKLQAKLTDKQAVKDIKEEVAYTWFNRLMAIKILEENGYIPKQLAYDEGVKTPAVVQNAKRGQHSLKKNEQKDLLMDYLQLDKDERVFGLLITHLCNEHKLLHDVFGRIDDYTEILLPQNLLQTGGVLDLINSEAISREDYKEVELIGWLYQFYIADRKDEVFAGFKKNKKARAEDIPAATQIFTPKWIVKYMVENTAGKLYLDFEPDSSLKDKMKYLVENESANGSPAIFEDITQLTLLDPACGSGHILVVGFDLLFDIYREQGYSSKQAVTNILTHNLYGLDIDDRAMQLARFALLLKAAAYDDSVLAGELQPHVYSFPEADHFLSEDVAAFLGKEGQPYADEVKEALLLLNQGKNIGSALKVELDVATREAVVHAFKVFSNKAANGVLDIQEAGLWQRLKPFIEVVLVLTNKYTAVVANPPYMGQKSMNADLKDYVNSYYPISKSDLFAVFMEVCLDLSVPKGLMGMINQHSWMFLSSYQKLRDKVISQYGILSMLHLGPRTFEELSGEVVQSTAFVLENGLDVQEGTYFRLVDYRNIAEKENQFLLALNKYSNIPQTNFSKIPGSPIAYWASERAVKIFEENETLEDIGLVRQGASTSDNNRFLRFWYEVNNEKIGFNIVDLEQANESLFKWFPYNKGGGFRKWSGNFEIIINYENDGYELKEFQSTLNQGWTVRLKSREYYFKAAVSWPKISSGSFSARYYPKGFIFDVAGCCYFPEDEFLKKVIVAFLNSNVTKKFLEFISPTLNYEIEQIKRLPFIVPDDLQSINSDTVFTLSKGDWDSRETSWDFERSPLLNDSITLVNAYQIWQERATQDFFQLHANEEELNRIFIDIYGLQDELTPEVALKDITILQDELDRNALEVLEPTFREQGAEAIELPIYKDEVMAQFLSYAVGIFMGRYRLDKPGLNIAHPNPTEAELASYSYNGHRVEIDEDAVIPLMGENCAFPDDALSRITHLLQVIWGEETLTENINFLQEYLGMDLHKWLTEKFWPYHVSMYKKKPIYWLFSSNPKKPQQAAFKVLAYMHRMDKYTVQKIQRNYLHPHQEYIKEEIEKLQEDEGSLDREGQKRLAMLYNWQIECRDYNEVLKELANQQIEFDLDDGVDVNIAKFEGAVAKI